MTVMKLYGAAKGQKEKRQIEMILENSYTIKFNFDVAKQAGLFLKHNSNIHNISVAEAIIAATAKLHKLELVTLNIKHFSMFPALKRPY